MERLSDQVSLAAKRYNFDVSLEAVSASIQKLDDRLGLTYEVLRTEKIADLNGIDRILTHKKTKHRISVEYKTDFASAKSNCVFIEMAVGAVEGWFFTTLSQVWIYQFPHLKEAVWLDFLNFKIEILKKSQAKELPIKHTVNGHFSAQGIILPIPELKKLGKVISLE